MLSWLHYMPALATTLPTPRQIHRTTLLLLFFFFGIEAGVMCMRNLFHLPLLMFRANFEKETPETLPELAYVFNEDKADVITRMEWVDPMISSALRYAFPVISSV